MNARRNTKLFFIELVFVLLSFALCATVCVQLFAKAHEKSMLSRETASALVAAQTAAECFKAMPSDEQAFMLLLNATVQNGVITVYYDETWEPVQQESPRVLSIKTGRESALFTAEITVSLHGEVLFALSVLRAMTGGDIGP